MSSAAVVVACALSLLGRSERNMPHIQLVAVAPPDASAFAAAYVRTGIPTIFLVTSSEAFQDVARSGRSCDYAATRKLASILVHEEWHILHGPDERGAYEAQLTTLVRFGASPGSAVYAGVLRAMQTVLAAQKTKRAELVLAQRY